MVSRSEVFHNLISRREETILDERQSFKGLKPAYEFLDSAFNEDGFESWVVEILSYTGEDRDDGTGEGSIKLKEHGTLIRNSFRWYDFGDDFDKGAANALKNNYEAMTGNSDFSEGYSQYDLKKTLKIISNSFDKKSETVTKTEKNTDTNQYKFNITKEHFRDIYNCLDKVFYPSDDQVENEIGKSVQDINYDEEIQSYLEKFPYPTNTYISNQLGFSREKILDERTKLANE